jgi:ribonuclease E
MSSDGDEAEGADGEPRDADADGEEPSGGEHKKRRRGRRGGKRNRHDRVEQAEDVPEAGREGDEAPTEAEPVAEIAAAATDDVVVSEAPAAEPEAMTEEAAPEAEKPKKPARRRSRKAEAAESAEVAVVANGEAVPAPKTRSGAKGDGDKIVEEKPAEPVVVSSTNDETKPRKSGWWQRKSFF